LSHRKDAAQRSDVRLDIRVTPEERERIKAMAKAAKTNMSDLVRRLVASEEKRVLERAKLNAAMAKARGW
jgi:uncharacterized protein (DUF1778 family)